MRNAICGDRCNLWASKTHRVYYAHAFLQLLCEESLSLSLFRSFALSRFFASYILSFYFLRFLLQGSADTGVQG